MNAIARDLQFAYRLLLKNPSVTAIAILAIALGIAVNTIVFSIIDSSLLHPLPVGDHVGVVSIYETELIGGEFEQRRMTDGNFGDYARQTTTFSAVVGARSTGLPITSAPDPLTPLMRQVSAGYFAVFGVEPLLGREFLPEEDQPGARQVILSHGFWQDFYGGDPEILGQTIELDREAYEIIGVMVQGFDDPLYSTQPALWLPLALSPDEVQRGRDFRGGRANLRAFGKIRRGRSLADVRADMERIATDLAERFPQANSDRGATVIKLGDELVETYRPGLLLLFAAVCFVLLIACGNVANLLLARAMGRRKEISLRCALGAGRLQLARQLLIEGLLLGFLGGALGIVLAALGLRPILNWVPSNFAMPRLAEASLDWRVLLFTLGITVLTGIVFGLLPVRRVFALDLESALSVGAARSTADRQGQRLRGLLVTIEIAASLVLLVGTALLSQSFVELRNMDTGVDTNGVLTVRVSARGQGYDERDGWVPFFHQAREALLRLPGIEAAGGTDILPMAQVWQGDAVKIPGQPTPEPGQEPAAMVRTITPGFFAAVGMPLLKGRDFDDRDQDEGLPVAIINRSMAETYWKDREPIGDSVAVEDEMGVERQIIGVVGSTRHAGTEPDPMPVMFIPHSQNPVPTLSLAIRGNTTEPAALLAPVKRSVGEISEAAPVYAVATLEELLEDMNWQTRFMMRLLGGFAVIALLLVASGIYAILSYFVAQQNREIGVRMVVGASRREIIWMVLGSSLRLTALGIGLGIGLAILLLRLIESQLYGVSLGDPVSFVLVVSFLTLMVVLASAVPALRAARIDPAVVLRAE